MSNDPQGTTTLNNPYTGRIDLGIPPLLKSCMKLCQTCRRMRWIVGKDRPLFAIVLTNQHPRSPRTSSLYCLPLASPLQRFRVTQSAHPKVPRLSHRLFFLPVGFCCNNPFISPITRDAREARSGLERGYIRISYLYPNGATALDNLHHNLAFCICAVGKSLK